jgi:hypothetical protein
MAALAHMWFMFKLAVVIFIIKQVWKWFITYISNTFLYMPNTPSKEMKYPDCNIKGDRSPSDQGLDFDDITVLTKDNLKLKGWFIKQKEPLKHATVIYFHGNAGNIGGRIRNIKYIFHQCEVNVIIVGYRGYGYSEGSPTQNGLIRDSSAVLDWALA